MTSENETAFSEARKEVRGYLRTVWWLVILRGLLLIALGVFALLSPLYAVAVLVIFFGAFALVDGIALSVAAVASRKEVRGWGWDLTHGILSIIAGLLILLLPGMVGVVGFVGTLAVRWFLVASRSIGGVLELVVAFGEKGIPHRGWRIAGGIISILFALLLAILIILNPIGTALALIWVFGVFAIIAGIILIVDSFALRSEARRVADKKG